jgi:tetratricopeptide (TPR) repeat protein
MGGGNTQVARPWLREIHIHGVHDHHYGTAHELVHILAAEFGSSVLRVSRKGLMINMGLVEGVAEALTLREGSTDLHTYARAMREVGLAPDARRIMNPAGFWSQAPRRAYTVAGSFVRWLIDTRGVQRFKRVYADGDFRAAYDEDLESLVGAWESTIDALPLLPRDRLEARHRFRRRSIFQRPCAHVIADLRARARRANPGEALRLQRRVCAFEGETPAARTALANALMRAGQDGAYVELTDELLAEPSLSPRQKVDLYEDRGERAWKRGELDEARRMFEAALDVQESLASERLNWVRLWALDRPGPERELLRRFLSNDMPKLVAVLELEHLWRADPAALTYPYLIARQLQQNGAWESALDYLEAARGHPFLPIEAERVRLVAEIQAVGRRWNEARTAYAAYADMVPAAGERARAHDEIERLDFWERGPAGDARAPRPGDGDDPNAGARYLEPESESGGGGPMFSRTDGDANGDAEVDLGSEQSTGGDRDAPSGLERDSALAGEQPAAGDDGSEL